MNTITKKTPENRDEYIAGFFPGPSAIEVFAGELTGYKASKGTIQFPYKNPLPVELIGKEKRVFIREILPEDNRALAKMIRDIFEEYDVSREGTVYSDPSTDNLFELFQKSGSLFWVALINNSIVGCCGIYPTEGLDKECVELVKFYISKEARGKGIGKDLMEKSIQSACQLGYRYLYLESFPQFAKAVSIYEKQGFRNLEHSLGNSGHCACNVWMIKELNK
ncbi:MAG: GNAT family N-acetyltransferase [Dysgonamonadaceae bacterium]|jgi:putative acetyltransferase|nr:GNAT family N-acetyltransferase [Dysgonamonadaceae bacterium]